MALKPVRPRLRNTSNGLAKVSIAVAPGDEIEVSEEVAAQVAAQRAPLVASNTPAAPEPTEPTEPTAEPEPAKPKARTRKAAGKPKG